MLSKPKYCSVFICHCVHTCLRVALSVGHGFAKAKAYIIHDSNGKLHVCRHHDLMFIILHALQALSYQALRRIPSLMNPAPVTERRLSVSTFPVTIASSKSLVRFSFSRVSLVFGRL